MKSPFRSATRWNRLPVAVLSLALLSPSVLALQSAAAQKPAPALTSAERRIATLVKADSIRTVTTALAAKEMQGRGTAQPGGDKAARFIADSMARLKLKPLGDGGAYLQAIKFKK